jgi:hypothetical protein
MIFPFTITLPSITILSASLLEAIPAFAKIFCIRSVAN